PDAPERVHEDGWVYPGCPHNGPGIAVGPDGQQHVVWYTSAGGRAGLYYAAVQSDAQRTTTPVALVTGTRLPAVHGSVIGLADGGAVGNYDVTTAGSRGLGVAVLARGGPPRCAREPEGEGRSRSARCGRAAVGGYQRLRRAGRWPIRASSRASCIARCRPLASRPDARPDPPSRRPRARPNAGAHGH